MGINETLPKSTLTFEFLLVRLSRPLTFYFAMTPVNAKLSVKGSDDRRRHGNARRCHSFEATFGKIVRSDWVDVLCGSTGL